MQWGAYELRLCPLSEDSDAAEAAELTEECLDAHPLELADGSGRYITPHARPPFLSYSVLKGAAEINFSLCRLRKSIESVWRCMCRAAMMWSS